MPRILRTSLDLDASRAMASLARAPGTVVLRRDVDARLGWEQPGSVVLFDPRWTSSLDGMGRWTWTGTPPSDRLTGCRPVDIPGQLATRLSAPRVLEPNPMRIPMVAGWIGFDAGSAALGARHPVPAPGSPPDLWLAAYDCALVLDAGATGLTRAELIVSDTSALDGRNVDLRERLAHARELLLTAAAQPSPHLAHDPHASVEVFDRGWHRAAVHSIQQHLLEGNSYQINLTGFAQLRTTRSAWDVFETECAHNPVGFAAYLNSGDHIVSSHSPELLLRARGGQVRTAPIKGTIASAPDALVRLRGSQKDRAEHVMIVDLCRNDLGRSARDGSVRVDDLMRALELRGLVHLVSEVSAELREGALSTVFADLFPGGSITGAPKRRSCAILRDLERSGRGPYTGAVGVIDGTGGMDWNIAIRTALWHNGAAWFGCGGGIVLDSDADREYEEAMLKARSYLASARGDAPTSHLLAGAAESVVAPSDGDA